MWIIQLVYFDFPFTKQVFVPKEHKVLNCQVIGTLVRLSILANQKSSIVPLTIRLVDSGVEFNDWHKYQYLSTIELNGDVKQVFIGE